MVMGLRSDCSTPEGATGTLATAFVWNAQAEPATGRRRSTGRLEGRTVSTVGNPSVDLDAFDAFEATGWEEKAVAYERFFGVITDRVVAPLLAAASVGVGARDLDVGTGPGWVAAHAAERGASVLGIDVAEAMIARARNAHPGA